MKLSMVCTKVWREKPSRRRNCKETKLVGIKKEKWPEMKLER